MNKETRTQIFKEAARIGEELLSFAEYDSNGASWQSMAMNHSKNRNDLDYVTDCKLEGLYSGNAGISLFFIELYKQTQKENHLNAAVDGMRWVVQSCRDNPSDFYSFYTGRLGISYVLLQMNKLTGAQHYLDQALEIAKPCDSFLQSPAVVDDLIGGTSGTLLGLLHLHAATGEAWLLEKADLFLKHLIDRSHTGPEGLYWDFSSKNIRGLCGFSHGAAGIGFVFLEAGRYLRNETFYKIAEEAFRYERYFYSPENKNWPDFRKGIWKPEDYDEHKKAYLNGNTDFFSKPQFMNAWCHCAAGIGLSRLRAFEILRKEVYAHETRFAIEQTEISDITAFDEKEDSRRFKSFTLCHGGGGNAEIFLEAYNVFQDEAYLLLAEKVALQALEVKKNGRAYRSGFGLAGFREDTSLFMGNAGIGYFYLKFLEPFKVPSILLPKIESEPLVNVVNIVNSCMLKATHSTIKKRMVQKMFKRTNFLIEKLKGPQLLDYFESGSMIGVSEEASYMDFVSTLLPSLKDTAREVVSDILALESKKYNMGQNIISNSLLSIKASVQTEQTTELLSVLNEKGLCQLQRGLHPDVHFQITGWDWHSDRGDDWLNNVYAERQVCPVLLKVDADEKVIERHLSTFSYSVLSAFLKKKFVKDVVEEVFSSFGEVSDEDEKVIKQSIFEQIEQALVAGLLVT